MMRCYACGGELRSVATAGRVRSHMGQPGFELPEHLSIPTCDSCGEEVTDEALDRAIDAAFAVQLAVRLARTESTLEPTVVRNRPNRFLPSATGGKGPVNVMPRKALPIQRQIAVQPPTSNRLPAFHYPRIEHAG